MKLKPIQTILAIILLISFGGMLYFFTQGLGKDPRQLDSIAVGKSISETAQNTPNINLDLPELYTGQPLDKTALPTPPYLLNIWGTWCPACYIEHPYLLTLSEHIPIIGIDWPANNDNEAADAKAFLAKHGNPYQHVLIDKTGKLIIDLGVYGAPETFLIGKDHTILKRYAGALNATVWETEFAPLLKP